MATLQQLNKKKLYLVSFVMADLSNYKLAHYLCCSVFEGIRYDAEMK